MDISVRVLTAGIWPTQSVPVCILPPACEMAFNVRLECFIFFYIFFVRIVPLVYFVQMFTTFYVSKHNGRKLTLNTMLGTADVKAVFYGPSTSQRKVRCSLVFRSLRLMSAHSFLLEY